MSRQNFLESSNEFSIYGVVRFTTYIISAVALYMEHFQVAAIAFGFGALLGFIRRIARIWEQKMSEFSGMSKDAFETLMESYKESICIDERKKKNEVKTPANTRETSRKTSKLTKKQPKFSLEEDSSIEIYRRYRDILVD